MRGLVVKIFVCSVLVQLVTHALWLAMAALFAGTSPGPDRLMQHVLPLYADLAGATLERDGPEASAALLARAEKAAGMKLQLRQGVDRCVPDPAMGSSGRAGGDGRYCVVAQLTPRGLRGWPNAVLLAQLVLVAVSSYWLARYLLHPIRRLSVAAEALGRGDLSARAGPKLGRRRDEAGALVRQFDRMAERIALLIQAQRRFIGDVSHEIKSPLARLTLALGLARRETGGLASARFDRMEDEVETISALIRELLTLSSLQASDSADRSRLVDLHAMVQGVIDDAGFEWGERRDDIRLDAPELAVQVRGDATLLRRAFENVLRNALFHTPPGTPVGVAIRRSGATVTLVVQDCGPGVPPDALERLFDPFYRVDEARARNTGGVGIGLAICERAIRLHGGRVWARNMSPTGLAVSLELPCAEALTANAPAAGALGWA